MTIDLMLLVAGLLHFALVPVSLSVPRVLRWKEEFARLSPLTRAVVWVHGAFLTGTIVAFGVLSIVGREEMAAGRGLGPALALFIGLFWLARLGVQLFGYRPGDWPRGAIYGIGRHALTALFATWAAVYLLAAGLAWLGGAP
jgi:hypothetical protein